MGSFCAATATAVAGFQASHGLAASGTCDETTWSALVEASWKLGDRLLFLTSPNLRGEDVADLQGSLARLGFDCGRVDGILGPQTARALSDFQSNCGVLSDGVCGIGTVQTLRRLSSQTGHGPGVAAVREQERVRSLGSLAACRVVVGQFGGLSSLTRWIGRELRLRNAVVMSLDEPEPVAQAVAANHFGADVYVGFESSPTPSAVSCFYRVPTFESSGGRALADAVSERLAALEAFGQLSAHASGLRLPVLRETRMPAVLCVLGPVRPVVDHIAEIGAAVIDALEVWTSPAG